MYINGSTIASNADTVEGHYDTGGCNYRSPDIKEVRYSKDCDAGEIDKKILIVPCLALNNNVTADPRCVSIADPEKPGLIFGDSVLSFQR